jgi:competence protein ComEC
MKVGGGKSGILVLVGLIFQAGCAGTIPGDPTSLNSDTTPESSIETANGTLEIHYINVGQSVSTLIISPDGETMLVVTDHYNDYGG